MGWNPYVRDIATYQNEDRRWIKTLLGYDQCRSITLDISMFYTGHFTAKGALPSGLALGKITATGKYGPYYDAAVDGRTVLAGFLFNSVNMVTDPSLVDEANLATWPDPSATLYWGPGIIDQDYLPVFTVSNNEGKLNAAGRTDLAMHLKFEGTDL